MKNHITLILRVVRIGGGIGHFSQFLHKVNYIQYQ